jgi:hypothetical protein
MLSTMRTEPSSSGQSGQARSSASKSGQRAALVIAAILVVALQRFVPYGQYVLYPFTLLCTWVHEMGHGITALLCGGSFKELLINGDTSGLAITAVVPGIRQAATAAGGLLAPPLVGALILALARRFSRAILWTLALALLVSLVLYVRTWVGALAMTPLCALIALVARYGGNDGRLFLAQLIGVLLALDTLTRTLGYLFVASANVGGTQRPSDIAGVAQALGGPIQLWGGLIALVAVTMLALGLWTAWRAPRQKKALP